MAIRTQIGRMRFNTCIRKAGARAGLTLEESGALVHRCATTPRFATGMFEYRPSHTNETFCCPLAAAFGYAQAHEKCSADTRYMDFALYFDKAITEATGSHGLIVEVTG